MPRRCGLRGAVRRVPPLRGAGAFRAPGHRGRERSRVELLVKQAGAEHSLILGVGVLAVNFSFPLPSLFSIKKLACTWTSDDVAPGWEKFIIHAV